MRASPIEAGSGQAKKTGRSKLSGERVEVGAGAVCVLVGAPEWVKVGVFAVNAEVGRAVAGGLTSDLPQAEKARRPRKMNRESLFIRKG